MVVEFTVLMIIDDTEVDVVRDDDDDDELADVGWLFSYIKQFKKI